MKAAVCGLVLALSTIACAARGATPLATATLGEADRVAVFRQYVERLPLGSRVRVQTLDGVRWSATLLSADHERVVLQPRGRLTEPPRTIPIASLQLIEPESHANNHLAKAVAIGVVSGAAAFLTILLVALAAVD